MRAVCVVALLVGISGCGGGDDGAPPSSMSTQASSPVPNPTPSAPTPAPDATQPPAAPLVVGTALAIDSGANGNPVAVRVARSANGDGFAVWRADDGTRHNLWANRYAAATAGWGSPINIEASSADISDFDLAVDARGNAAVVWQEQSAGAPFANGMVMGVRFESSTGAWAAPLPLNTDGSQPRVASDASGAVLVVYATGNLIRGRFFDTVSGTWQPETAIEQNNTGTGFSHDPMAMLDGSGNALTAFANSRASASIVASNYFSRNIGDWGRLGPFDFDLLGGVPGSFAFGGNGNVQLATTTDGNFLLAWESVPSFDGPQSISEVRISRFTSRNRTWSEAQTLVPGSAQKNVALQRLGSDAAGNAHVLWTESDGMRTVLKAIRLDAAGAACEAAQVIDAAVGGGAARAELGVDPSGHAIAIWQHFEDGRPDDGSRSNIAVNRFDGAWASAVFAETQPGNAISPRASASGGQALLGWIQSEGGANRVKALLQPLANTPGR